MGEYLGTSIRSAQTRLAADAESIASMIKNELINLFT
jgi:hypothetical protein